jgi:hypothetical protein
MMPTTHDEPLIADRPDADLGETCPRCCWPHEPAQRRCKGTVVDIIMEPLDCGCVRKMQRRERWAGDDCIVTWAQYGNLAAVCAALSTRREARQLSDAERANLFAYVTTSPNTGRNRTGD